MDSKILLGRLVVLVGDYDEAYAFYEKAFGCFKIYDETTPQGERYLHVGFGESHHTGIWFLRPSKNESHKIGAQTGGEPLMVLYTDDIFPLFDHLKDLEVTILEDIVITPKSKFFHCKDLYGNRIIIVELS